MISFQVFLHAKLEKIEVYAMLVHIFLKVKKSV